MPRLLCRYATPLVTGLFLVSLISGLALFFHVGPSGFHGMHEWLSLLLILPFVLHLWRNWRPMTGYLRHAPMAVAAVLSVALSLPFFLGGASDGGARVGPPVMQLGQAVMQATPAALAPALGLSEAEVTARLAGAGLMAAPGQSLREIAAAAGADAQAVAAALLAASSPASE